MTDNEVKCLICGEVCETSLVSHLRKCHGLSTQEYRKLFPGASVLSKIRSESISQMLVERNKSKKQRDAISCRNRDPEFQKKCQAGITEEVRQVHADTMRRVSKELWTHEDYRQARSQGMSDLMKRLNQDPEYTKARSEIMKKTWENPESAAKMIQAPKSHPYGVQSKFDSKKFGKSFWCRSQGEREFLEFCEVSQNVFDVVSGEKFPIKYEDESGESHTYLPDFIVTTNELSVYIVEVKYEGDQILGYRCKVNAAVDFCKLHNMTYCYVNRFSGISKIKEHGFESVAVLERI